MKVILADSIPAAVQRRYGWAIKAQARKVPDGESTFYLQLTPPMPRDVTFKTALTEKIETQQVHFARIPIVRGGERHGFTVVMTKPCARAAVAFIEKHFE